MYQKRTSIRKKKKGKRLFTLILFLCLVGLGLFFLKHLISSTESKNSMQPNQKIMPENSSLPQETPMPTTTVTANAVSSLQQAIQRALTGTYGTFGIVVKNLKTGETYTQNAETTFDSASLYKLWVMAVVYDQISQGKLSESDTLTQDAAYLNNEFGIDTDNAEQTSGSVSTTVSDALNQMITISDNEDALLLTDKVGLNAITQFLQNNGLLESKIGLSGNDPTTTPHDIVNFFELLYNDKLNNQAYTNEMISLLKQQALNEKIPEYLPLPVVTAHKTGELDDYSHDAGIVYGPNGDYILVVLTQSDNPILANERIAEVSLAVYNYFNNK